MQQAYTAYISFYVIARSVSFGNDHDRLIEISESTGVFPLSLICMNETCLKSLAKSCVIYGIPPSLFEKCIFPLLRNVRIQCRCYRVCLFTRLRWNLRSLAIYASHA